MKKMIALLSVVILSSVGVFAQKLNDVDSVAAAQIARKVAESVFSASSGNGASFFGMADEIYSHAAKTADAMPGFLKEEYEDAVKQEAVKTFTAYFIADAKGEVKEAAYKPLAELLTAAIGLNRMIARTPNVDDRENYAIQWFFSNDIPGKYNALKAVNPELAAATNELMKSFMNTVSNGAFYGEADHPDMKAMREFKQAIGYRY